MKEKGSIVFSEHLFSCQVILPSCACNVVSVTQIYNLGSGYQPF